MADLLTILDMLDEVQEKVEDIKDELGRLQAQASVASAGVAQPDDTATARVIPPTAPESEIVGGQETDEFPDCCAVGDDDVARPALRRRAGVTHPGHAHRFTRRPPPRSRPVSAGATLTSS